MIKEPVVTIKDNKKFVLFFHEYGVNGVCSNWYLSNFEVDGVTFSCVEQYMMYRKAMLFGDRDIAEKVLGTTNQKEMKDLGRKVKGFCNGVWDANKYKIVVKGITSKFNQNEELKEWILKADCDYFVECSPYDNIWGIKLSIDDSRALDITKWNGQNLLGKALKVAQELLKE